MRKIFIIASIVFIIILGVSDAILAQAYSDSYYDIYIISTSVAILLLQITLIFIIRNIVNNRSKWIVISSSVAAGASIIFRMIVNIKG